MFTSNIYKYFIISKAQSKAIVSRVLTVQYCTLSTEMIAAAYFISSYKGGAADLDEDWRGLEWE